MQKTKIIFLFFFFSFEVFSQSTYPSLKLKTRFNTYLNYKGSLSSYVQITDKDVRIYKNRQDKLQGKVELLISFNEITTFNCLIKNVSTDSVEAIILRKGCKTWDLAAKEKIEKLCQKEKQLVLEKKLLSGKRIAIDPGHIAGDLKMAWIEQKYLRFLKDSIPDLPSDSVRVAEGILTFATAQILKHQLEEQGADVLLTRKDSATSFKLTYQEWLRLKKTTTLDSLKALSFIDSTKYNQLQSEDEKTFFWDFFRDYELAERVKTINNYKPDLTIIIHYNVDEKNKGWSKPSDNNFCMAFVPGALTSDAFKSTLGKINFLRLLLSTDFSRSEKIAGLTVKEFSKQLGVTVAQRNDAEYLKTSCLKSSKQGVFCRNLILCRLVNSPLVYGECLYQDNKNEYFELSKTDKNYYGVSTNSRIKCVSDAYFNAIMQYFN